MVQVIKPDQLSPIAGNAGKQQVVNGGRPGIGSVVGSLTDIGAKTFDTAGTVYAKNKSQEIVNEELGNIESAINLAEQSRDNENFVKPDEMPVTSSEFDIIQSAVASGAMTREKARLVAQSRLRSRISENPFFADKLRAAASSLIGFNIQSEPAQQYFASFQTEASRSGSSAKTQQQKWWDQAEAESVALGVPAEDIYRQLAQESYATRQKETSLARKESGLIDDMEAFNEMNAENSAVDFGSILGNFKAVFQENGSVDEVAANQILTQAKATRLAELDQIFDDQTSGEYQRAQAAIESRFESYKGFIDSVGFDALNEIKIERVKAANEILGNEMFRLEKLVIQNLGSDAFTQTMDMISTIRDPSQLEAMFRGSPTSGKVAAILGNKTALKAFGGQMGNIYKNIATGQEMDDTTNNPETDMTDAEVADTVLGKMIQAGGESEDGAVDYMNEMGMQTKPVSLITQKNPNRATEDSRTYFKRMYENTLPQFTEDLGEVLAANPDLEWTIDENGTFNITQPMPRTDIRGTAAMRDDMRRVQRQMRGYNQAQELATHINLYGQGISRGWGNVVETSPKEFRKKMADTVDKGFVRYQQVVLEESANLVLDRDEEAARESFESLKRLDEKYKGYSYEQFAEAMRRRAGLGE